MSGLSTFHVTWTTLSCFGGSPPLDGMAVLRFLRRATLLRADLGHDGAQVLGRRTGASTIGDGGGGVAEARAHLDEAPGGARRRAALGATGLLQALHVVSGVGVSPVRVETSTRPVARQVR